MPLLLRYLPIVLLLCGSMLGAQTLAHPGWRGNGIASEAWWKHSALVRLGADTTFAKAAGVMDAMSEAGVDGMVLPEVMPTGAAGAAQPFDEKFGTADDLDALLREASARRMHVLLRADLLRLASNSGELRFWMSRGIAGFDVGEVTVAERDSLQLLRSAMNAFPGRRILLAHLPDAPGGRQTRQDAAILQLIPLAEAVSRTGLPSAVEVHTAEDLKVSVPPNTALVIDAGLLADQQLRENVRHAIAAAGTRARASGNKRSR